MADQGHVPLTNIFAGTATLGAGGLIAVPLSQILATSSVQVSSAAANNTGTLEYTINVGVGFTITSSQAGDTGLVSWLVAL